MSTNFSYCLYVLSKMGSCLHRPANVSPEVAVKVTKMAHVMRNLRRLSISDLIDVCDKEALISRRIDAYLAKEKKVLKNTVKLLLLGPAESGKTTLLKQMK